MVTQKMKKRYSEGEILSSLVLPSVSEKTICSPPILSNTSKFIHPFIIHRPINPPSSLSSASVHICFELSHLATMNGSKHLVSVQPEELKFHFELEKQTYCDLKVTNNTDNNVAFKVKTTSPRKYFVRPNTGVIHPWDSSIIRVTLQAQREYLPDMICRDKFLLQSTLVPPHTDTDTLQSNTFDKESGRVVEESKLRVLYLSPDKVQDSNIDDNPALRHLREERDVVVRQTRQLQQELEVLRSRQRKGLAGFTLRFATLVALIGIFFGFLLKIFVSSPSSTP